MRVRPLVLVALLAVTPGLAACGGDDEISDAVPRSTPELTIPTATTEAPAGDDGAGSSTSTSTTSTSTTPATGAGGGAPAAPAAPAPAAPTPPTGGQAPTDQGQGDETGGAAAGGGEFEDFCAQNPGAC